MGFTHPSEVAISPVDMIYCNTGRLITFARLFFLGSFGVMEDGQTFKTSKLFQLVLLKLDILLGFMYLNLYGFWFEL